MKNSQLEKLAMEQMSRMTPEQLAQIQGQMGNFAPGAMERVQKQLAGMTDQEMDNIVKKMSNTDPSTFQAASSAFKARQSHAYQTSLSLKNEGNGLFKEGNYMLACEKYERAKSNLSLFVDQESHALVIACGLNLANCFLKLEMHTRCIQECTEVLKSQQQNTKALFRRGQAYVGQKKLKLGLDDLKAALKWTDSNATVERNHIQKKIEEVEELIKEIQPEEVLEESVKVEEIIEESAEAEEIDRLKKSAERLGELSDDQISKMSEMTGMKMSPEMVRAGMEAMNSMDSETLAKMPALVEKLKATEISQKPADHSASSSQPTGYSMSREDMASMSEVFQRNPELVKEQAQRLSEMQQGDLDRITELSGAAGLKITPEMAKQAAEAFQKMDPAQLEKLPHLASEASTSSAHPASMANLSPEMMQSMTSAFTSMDESTLAGMLQSTGMCKDSTQAERLAKQMKSISPKQMEMIMKAQQFAMRGSQAAQTAKKWLMSRAALVIAIVILIVAVILRQFEN